MNGVFCLALHILDAVPEHESEVRAKPAVLQLVRVFEATEAPLLVG